MSRRLAEAATLIAVSGWGLIAAAVAAPAWSGEPALVLDASDVVP